MAFSHVADQRRPKLEDEGKAMLFVEYHPTSEYKLYNPIKEKMVLSMDVMVLEDENWDWKQGQTNLKKTMVHGIFDDPTQSKAESTYIIRSNADLENTSQRPRRQPVRPSRFSDYEIYFDAGVNDEGDLVQMALMVGT